MDNYFSKPQAFTCKWDIDTSLIDHYGHVNNVAYVKQLEVTAWRHSNALGLTIEAYQEIDRGMAIIEHHIKYLGAVLLDDVVICATWITHCDKRLTLTRYFEFYSMAKQKIILQAETKFACIALSSGKPKKMPEQFVTPYYSEMLRQC